METSGGMNATGSLTRLVLTNPLRLAHMERVAMTRIEHVLNYWADIDRTLTRLHGGPGPFATVAIAQTRRAWWHQAWRMARLELMRRQAEMN